MKNELKSPNIIITVITSGILGAIISNLIEQVMELPIDKATFIGLISLIILLSYYTHHWYAEAHRMLDKENDNHEIISGLNHEKQELQQKIDVLELRVTMFEISKTSTVMPVEKPAASNNGPYFTQA